MGGFFIMGKAYFSCDYYDKCDVTYIESIIDLVHSCFDPACFSDDKGLQDRNDLKVEVAAIKLKRKKKTDLTLSVGLLFYNQGWYFDREIVTLSSLCTRQGFRRKGYANQLIQSIFAHLGNQDNLILSGDFLPDSKNLVQKHFSEYIFKPMPFGFLKKNLEKPQKGSEPIYFSFN